MSKTQEELNQLKIEYETLNNKLKELSEDELKQVSGGYAINSVTIKAGECFENHHFIYKVKTGVINAKISDCVKCVVNDKVLKTTETDDIQVSKLINNCTYIGDNII